MIFLALCVMEGAVWLEGKVNLRPGGKVLAEREIFGGGASSGVLTQKSTFMAADRARPRRFLLKVLLPFP